jgi:hypothetical protein
MGTTGERRGGRGEGGRQGDEPILSAHSFLTALCHPWVMFHPSAAHPMKMQT